jgi:hypothetical protein
VKHRKQCPLIQREYVVSFELMPRDRNTRCVCVEKACNAVKQYIQVEMCNTWLGRAMMNDCNTYHEMMSP